MTKRKREEKKQNKVNSDKAEEAAERLAEIFIMQIEAEREIKI